MELLLWRWSTAVQATSLVTITLFFAVLARAVGLAEVRWWARAWAVNLAALGATLFFWYFQPRGGLFLIVRMAYMLAKTAFVILLIHGAWTLKRPGERLAPARAAAAAVLAYVVVAGPLTTSIDRLGVVQNFVTGVLLAAGAAALLGRPRESGLGWLAAGVAIRAALSLAEAVAYGVQLVEPGRVSAAAVGGAASFLAASSSFDSGAEWLVALGCVLAFSERVQRELRQSNAGLLAAQEDLRRLADRDPLTALANRRYVPEAFREVQPRGALLLFFDLDDFKQINDRYGHHVGDECLRRFAAALRECFRPGDVLIRYGGDEFLVIATGLEDAGGLERIARLRERLRFAPGGGPTLSFSAGTARLAPGGHPDEAIKAADESMYAAKAARSSRSVRVG